MTQVILQPCTDDNYMATADPDTNHGGFAQLYIGGVGANKCRTLMKFDLSGIPPAAACSAATLGLYITGDFSDNARTLTVYRSTRAWTEAGSTWNKYDGANAWATAGGMGAGDYDATAVGTRAMGAAEAVGWISVTLTPALVAAMWNGGMTNNGFLIVVDTESSDAYEYSSSEHGTAAQRPKLTIDYAILGSSPSWWF